MLGDVPATGTSMEEEVGYNGMSMNAMRGSSLPVRDQKKASK